MSYAKLRRKWLRAQRQKEEVLELRRRHIISNEEWGRRFQILLLRIRRLEGKMSDALRAREQANQQS